MLAFLMRRLLLAIPTLFLISVVVYALLALKPGDPIDELRFGNPGFTHADYERLIKLYGLDKPWYIRYWYWLSRAVRGDFGPSRRYGMPAAEFVFRQRMPNTLLLSGLSLLVAFAVAVPAGVWCALRRHSFVDYAVTTLNFVGISVPVFWLGILLIYVFSVRLGWLPAGSLGTPGVAEQGLGAYVVDRLRHLVLPVLALSSIQMATWTRFMRSSMLEVIHDEYIRTARAKGLPERAVVLKHALRNAILPIITLVALAIPGVFSGAVLTETVFNWPGMGRAIYDAILANDFNVAMVALMFISLWIILCNILADVAYALADPRIRYD
ncbi:MAG: ABC transporter permease [Candidatus Bipolaricaulota bacterium]|nr:ABC transporter permease [Candidatus Bipolaricaulota bacterium]MCX7843813.1 ABC transporter permease [Candidatus Bipolaricaulota bacterium]MDW8151395.1 ABC transporter permease [Candidatus Bipolaricaulota bacterium]